MIQDDKWVLDMEWLHQLACDGLDEEPEPVDKGSRADTVDAVKNVLYEHLRSAYSYYCDQIEKGNGRKLLKQPTMAWIGKQVGKDRTTVSRIIEPVFPTGTPVIWKFTRSGKPATTLTCWPNMDRAIGETKIFVIVRRKITL